MSRRMNVLLALSAGLLTLLILTFIWQAYGLAADRGWIVLDGYPMALTIAWGVALLGILMMEGCLALHRYSIILGVALSVTLFLVARYFFGFDQRMGYYTYTAQFLGQYLETLYRLFWYVLVVLFIVLLMFNAAFFLDAIWRTRLLVSAGIVLFVISLWIAFMYYDTATIWCAGALALWWEAALWRRERGTVSRMLKERDALAVFALISSLVAPMVIYGLYDTLTFSIT